MVTIVRAALRVAAALLVCSIAFAQSASPPPQKAESGGQSAPRFDGNWLTKLTCPAKGNTEGYTWKFASVIQNSNFRGEHGTAGEPGYRSEERRVGTECRSRWS